jgi:hypothetical protein
LGYAKAYAATSCVKDRRASISFEETFRLLARDVTDLHDPLTWGVEVERRRAQIERGAW